MIRRRMYIPRKVFMCHTQLDKATCDRFDNAVARVGIDAFRSEYENLAVPAWKTISKEIKQSMALFLLVGPELVNAQSLLQKDWVYTQNWISYEIGLASAMNKDIWVICDNVDTNFPIPHLNNYAHIGQVDTVAGGFMTFVLENYQKGLTFPLGYRKRNIMCPNNKCGAQYNLHTNVNLGSSITCPSCLSAMTFQNGWTPQ